MTELSTALSSNGNSANVMLRQDTKSNLHTSQSLEDISVLAKLIFTSYHHKYTAHFVVDTLHLVLSVLGKLGPGQSGPRQLGPRRLGPKKWTQLSTFWGVDSGPRTLGQCIKSKIPKTIQKCHFYEIWHFWMFFWIFLFTGMSD